MTQKPVTCGMRPPNPLTAAAAQGEDAEKKVIITFRKELTFSEVKPGEYTLYDPANTRYFQFKEYEYAICSLLDGTNTVEDVLSKFEEQFDAVLPLDTLKAFIQKMFNLGLIEGAAVPAKAKQKFNPLFMKYKIFNPDKLFDVLINYVGFLFKPKNVWIFVGVCLLAAFMALIRWNELSNYGMPQFGHGQWIGYTVFGIAVLSIISIHEFAHGLSLKYYGGKVPEIGFMLRLFIPAFYCDVTDAWRLSKNKKLFVTFAGGFSQVVIGSIAVIIWFFAEPHLWLSDLAYLVIFGSFFTMWINLNPLIKLDGYYMLSDFLEMPNMKNESTKVLVVSIAKFFGIQRKLKYNMKEKVILFIYAILSNLFILFMLGMIFSMAANFLIDTFKLIGIITSLVVFALFMKNFIVGQVKMALQPD